MAGWRDERPVKVYEIRWKNGEVGAVRAQGVSYPEGHAHTLFWCDNEMVLSVNEAETTSILLVEVLPA